MSVLLDFYRGTGTDHKGRTIKDILAFTDEEFERGHDFIQWLFPLPEPSKFQPKLPTLTEEDLVAFKTPNEDIWVNIKEALLRAIAFYNDTAEVWCHPNNHNLLRITRIIRFYTITGRSTSAHLFHGFMRSIAEEYKLDEKSLWYWDEALNPQPAWLTT